MLSIRLQRVGTKNAPSFRVVVMPKHRDPYGKVNEILGHYNPRLKEMNLKADRIKHWIDNGAEVTNTVWNLLVEEKIVEGKKRTSTHISKKRGAKLAEKEEAKKQAEKEAKEKAEAEAQAAKEKAEAEAQAAKEEAEAAAAAENAEEAKIEETPAEETKAEETPAEETPAEETKEEAAPEAEETKE